MTTAQAIAQHIETLPEAARREVLDFETKTQRRVVRESDPAWSSFSLASAMRGMEDEPSLYTIAAVFRS